MALHITNPEVEQQVRELALERGESITEVTGTRWMGGLLDLGGIAGDHEAGSGFERVYPPAFELGDLGFKRAGD